MYVGLRFNVSGDTLSLERRIFFEDGNSEFSREITANIDGQSCTTIKAYVQVCIDLHIYRYTHNSIIVTLSLCVIITVCFFS